MAKRKSINARSFLARGPFVGVNTQIESRSLNPKEAEDASNIVLDDGTLKARDGYDAGAVADNAGVIEGQHDYRQADGTRIHLVKSDNQLYKLSSGGTYTAIGGALLVTGNVPQFLTVNNRTYIAHGAVPYVTDGTTLNTWEITRPATVPTVAIHAPFIGGNKTGIYDYKITFYSVAWGQESTASDASGTVSASAGNIDLSELPVSADSRVLNRRLYRRKVSALETEWAFIAQLNNTDTTYTDSILDSDASVTRIAPLSFSDAFPWGNIIAHNAGTMFMAGVATEPNKLYFSPVNSTSMEDFLFLEDEGTGITGLLSFQSELVIFTTRSIWVLSGNNRRNFFLRKVIPDRGCVAPFSIVPVDNLIYFLSENGFYAYDLSTVTEVSRPVQDIILDRNHNKDIDVIGMHDIRNNAIWWLYGSSGGSAVDTMLVHYYRNSVVAGASSWVPWTITGLRNMTQVTNDTTGIREPRLGFDDGRVSTYTGGDDNGTAIDWSWTTGKQDIQTPSLKKFFNVLTLENVRKTTGSIDVATSIDTFTDFDFVGRQHDMTSELFRTRLARRASQIRLKFSGSTTGGAEIIGWTLQAEASAKS